MIVAGSHHAAQGKLFCQSPAMSAVLPIAGDVSRCFEVYHRIQLLLQLNKGDQDAIDDASSGGVAAKRSREAMRVDGEDAADTPPLISQDHAVRSQQHITRQVDSSQQHERPHQQLVSDSMQQPLLNADPPQCRMRMRDYDVHHREQELSGEEEKHMNEEDWFS
jgi:hypothetical protein